MIKYVKIIILFFLFSCASSSSYDCIYFKSLQGDSINIINFIKINNIYDANGYNHGEKILTIIEAIGDSTFSVYINKLKNENQLRNLKDYIEVTENIGNNPINIKSKYPLTYKALNR